MMRSSLLALLTLVAHAGCKDAPAPTPAVPAPTAAPAIPASAPDTAPATTTAAPVTTTAAPATVEDPPRVPDIEYVPTPPNVVAKMLEVAEVKKTDVVYDLGCGDGRIVIAAAKERGARGIGFDIDPVRVAESRANVEKAGVGTSSPSSSATSSTSTSRPRRSSRSTSCPSSTCASSPSSRS